MVEPGVCGPYFDELKTRQTLSSGLGSVHDGCVARREGARRRVARQSARATSDFCCTKPMPEEFAVDPSLKGILCDAKFEAFQDSSTLTLRIVEDI
jgi:hypothetical protein